MGQDSPIETLETKAQTSNESTIIYIVLLGFLLSYILFFIIPVFLNPEHRMLSESGVPIWHEIGSDIKRIHWYFEAWRFRGVSPNAEGCIYAPLAFLAYAPLQWVDFGTAYFILTTLTILSYVFATFLIPLRILKAHGNESLPLLVLFSVTGAFSYGFQFELERGQFNVIAFFLSLLAVYFYYYSKKYWYLSYLLITLAIQLKIWPLIFLIFLAGNWRNWSYCLARLCAILVFNFGCLFILGTDVFYGFMHTLSQKIGSDFFILTTNHSIASFSGLFPKYGTRFLPMIPSCWLVPLSWFFKVFFVLSAVTCFCAIWWASLKRPKEGMDPTLLLGCVLMACLIPSESIDYKLPVLAAPVLLFFTSLQTSVHLTLKWFRYGIVFVMAFAYSATLYPGAYKPLYLTNNCPLLMIILAGAAICAVLDMKRL